MQQQLAGEVAVVGAVIGEALHEVEQGQAVPRHHRARDGQKQLAVDEPEERVQVVVLHLAAAEGQHLVEEGERVSGAALGGAGQAREGLVGDLDLLRVRHLAQVGLDLPRRDHPEVVLLATREDRVRQLVVLGGGEDELHLRGRLLQGLQKRVEGPRGEHVDLVDDPDLEAVAGGVVARALPQLAHLLDAVVGGPVDLLHVEGAALGDFLARGALEAGLGGRTIASRAVEGLGQDARGGGLAHAPCPREEEGVADATGAQGVLQGTGEGGLADQLVEGVRPVLSRENEIAHGDGGEWRGGRPHVNPGYLRHTRGASNRCSLPGLAGFRRLELRRAGIHVRPTLRS